MQGRDLPGVFSYIYESNLWDGEESKSGIGSGSAETSRLREWIPALLQKLGAGSLLDIPCGDFRWMSELDLGPIGYTGGDIVPAIIENNQRRFETAQRRFVLLDLARDPLPRADVVLCRDCLVHLSFRNIAKALENLRASGAAWLLTTTFTEHAENQDVEDGDWRMLNLERPPFRFPQPEALLVEGCQEGGGAYADKSLGLWRVAALP